MSALTFFLFFTEILFGFDRLCFLGRLGLVLLNRLVAICLR